MHDNLGVIIKDVFANISGCEHLVNWYRGRDWEGQNMINYLSNQIGWS